MYAPIGFIAVAIAVPLVYGYLRKFYPPAEHAPGDEGLEALGKVHHRTEIVGMLAYLIILAPLCTYAWYRLFIELPAHYIAGANDALAVITPGGFYWVMVALLPGAVTAAFPADLLVRFLRRGHFHQWIRYLEHKWGFRQDRKGPWILLPILIAPAIVLVLLTLNWYFVLTADEIRINTFTASQRVYQYNDVTEILMDVTTFANTDYVRRIYEFNFTDGYSYRTTPGLIGGRQDRWTGVARIIAQRSGVDITETDLPDP